MQAKSASALRTVDYEIARLWQTSADLTERAYGRPLSKLSLTKAMWAAAAALVSSPRQVPLLATCWATEPRSCATSSSEGLPETRTMSLPKWRDCAFTTHCSLPTNYPQLVADDVRHMPALFTAAFVGDSTRVGREAACVS